MARARVYADDFSTEVSWPEAARASYDSSHAPRPPCQLPARALALRRSVETRCEVVRARDYSLVGTHIVDLSTRGMLLETEAPVMTGEELLVLFRGPSGNWYDCDATVARVPSRPAPSRRAPRDRHRLCNRSIPGGTSCSATR